MWLRSVRVLFFHLAWILAGAAVYAVFGTTGVYLLAALYCLLMGHGLGMYQKLQEKKAKDKIKNERHEGPTIPVGRSRV